MCFLNPNNWSVKDWIYLSSFFGIFGSFLLVKGSIFNPHSHMEATTFFGSNPYLELSGNKRRKENLLGFIFVGLSFSFQFFAVIFPDRWTINNCSLIFANRFYSTSGILLIVFFIISFIPNRSARKIFRLNNSKTYLDTIEENILEVNSGYLRKDLREKSFEERDKISNLKQCIEGTKEQIKERITNAERLFEIKPKGKDDMERLENIRSHLKNWLC